METIDDPRNLCKIYFASEIRIVFYVTFIHLILQRVARKPMIKIMKSIMGSCFVIQSVNVKFSVKYNIKKYLENSIVYSSHFPAGENPIFSMRLYFYRCNRIFLDNFFQNFNVLPIEFFRVINLFRKFLIFLAVQFVAVVLDTRLPFDSYPMAEIQFNLIQTTPRACAHP